MKKIIIYTKEKIYNFKSDNDKNYYHIFEQAHRENGPAVIRINDDNNIEYKSWYINGILHRIDDPAIIWYFKNGNIAYKAWYIKGKQHRIDGPVRIKYSENGDIIYIEYRLNGKKYSKEDFNQEILKRKLQLI